jgi:hypothetical protein
MRSPFRWLGISKPIWIAIWAVATLQTLVGWTTLFGTRGIDIEFPGVIVAMLLYWLFLRMLIMFPSYGRGLFAVVTVLTNVLVYAALVSLGLRVRKIFKRES